MKKNGDQHAPTMAVREKRGSSARAAGLEEGRLRPVHLELGNIGEPHGQKTGQFQQGYHARCQRAHEQDGIQRER